MRLELVGVGDADRVVGELGVEVAEQRIATLDQPRPVGVGHAQQATQHPHRQLLGDRFDEVEVDGTSAGQRLVEHRRGPATGSPSRRRTPRGG